jgi:SAM-dependent methyltransferase
MAAVAHFVEHWLDQRSDDHLLIVDHGSYDVNGSYRSLFDRPSWRYVGVDLEPGPNVDLVLPAPYAPLPFADSSVDVVVSGQVLEHTAFPWVLVGEWSRVLKPGGLLCVVVPSAGPEHQYPIDCYRYLPDGLGALISSSGLHVVQLAAAARDGWSANSAEWADSMAVARRGAAPPPVEAALARERADRLSPGTLDIERTVITPGTDLAAARAAAVWGAAAMRRAGDDAGAERDRRREWNTHPVVASWIDRRTGGPFLQWVRNAVTPVGGTMVSFGCGAAGLEIALLESGAISHLVLVDVAEEALTVARATADAAEVTDRITFIAEAISLELVRAYASTSDVVYICDALHHFADPTAILATIADALRPGGILIGRDYVGPTHFAFDAETIAHAQQLYATLPAQLRSPWPELPVPDPAAVAAFDPTEAVASASIRSALVAAFPEVAITEVGGALAHLVWYGVDHDAMFEHPDADPVIEAICARDGDLTNRGIIPSAFIRFLAVR